MTTTGNNGRKRENEKLQKTLVITASMNKKTGPSMDNQS
jgi:hypothetical protein